MSTGEVARALCLAEFPSVLCVLCDTLFPHAVLHSSSYLLAVDLSDEPSLSLRLYACMYASLLCFSLK